MYEVFNMGIGMVAIVSKGKENDFLKHFHKFNKRAFLVGEITSTKSGEKRVNILDEKI